MHLHNASVNAAVVSLSFFYFFCGDGLKDLESPMPGESWNIDFQPEEMQKHVNGGHEVDGNMRKKRHLDSSSRRAQVEIAPCLTYVTERCTPFVSISSRPPLRNACDFCHSKRIKCRSVDGSKCQQCTQRGIECKFSLKEKTGPKPKALIRSPNSSTDDPHSNNTSSPIEPKQSLCNLSETNNYARVAVIPYSFESNGSAVNSIQFNDRSKNKHRNFHKLSHSRKRAVSNMVKDEISEVNSPRNVPSESGAEVMSPSRLAQEWAFLRAYLCTVARLLPLCDPKELNLSMSIRKQQHIDVSTEGRLSHSLRSTSDAELVAALSLGALICRQNEAAESYHNTARLILAEILTSAPLGDSSIAPLLCMLAFYWHCSGNLKMKDAYLSQAMHQHSPSTQIPGEKDTGSSLPSLHLQICIEHLNCSNFSNTWPKVYSMGLPPRLWALALVSSVLRDLPSIMASTQGEALTLSYSQELEDCAAAVYEEEGNELPVLVCRALQALLLMLLGHSNDAVTTISYLPLILDANPTVVRSMPLAWDMSLLASMLAFTLDSHEDYSVLHRTVEWAQNTTVSTQWLCRLPSTDCPLSLWTSHTCTKSPQSLMNVCKVVAEVSEKTQCGKVSFFSWADFKNNRKTNVNAEDSTGQGSCKLDKLAKIASSYLNPSTNNSYVDRSTLNSYNKIKEESCLLQVQSIAESYRPPLVKSENLCPSNLNMNVTSSGSFSMEQNFEYSINKNLNAQYSNHVSSLKNNEVAEFNSCGNKEIEQIIVPGGLRGDDFVELGSLGLYKEDMQLGLALDCSGARRKTHKVVCK